MTRRRREHRRVATRSLLEIVALALVAVCGPPCVASSSTELSRAARRLGSTEFTARHDAGDVLLRAGASAIPYLREAAGSEVPEIRFRASELLQRIELQVLDAQKAEVLSGSLTEGQLPAWDRYRQIVDDSEPARRLFVAMLERSPQLLLSIGTSELAEVFDRRVNDWGTSASPWARRESPDGTEILAALLLAASQPECTPTQVQAQLISRSAEYSWFQAQLNTSDRSRPLRSIVTAWIVQTGRGSADARLHLAQHCRYREGIVPAREIIAGNGTGLEIQSAILFLSAFGEEQDVPRLERLLDNETELQNFQSRRPAEAMKTQVRDVALVALWKMRREDPTDHGLKDYLEQNGAPRPGSIGFHDEDARRTAIAHWRGWRKRYVKADLPPDGWAVEGWRG